MIRQLRALGALILFCLSTLVLFKIVTALGSPPAGRQVAQSTAGQAAAAEPKVTAVSKCGHDGIMLLCTAGASEYRVHTTVTATTDIPPAFTGCRQNDSDIYCLTPAGNDVEITLDADDASQNGGDAVEPARENCHFHASIEHCAGTGSDKEGSTRRCTRIERNYSIPLRVGMLFVILVTNAIGVFGPIFLGPPATPRHIVFSVLKQFGTGVIISTAFVHLLTHAYLMFADECLGELPFEGRAASMLMAGLFLAFSVEYAGTRLLLWHAARMPATFEAGLASISVPEAGIIFHSLLIGLTLVVAGDTFFPTLSAVIALHQVIEGLALGTHITVPRSTGNMRRPLLNPGPGCQGFATVAAAETKTPAPYPTTTTDSATTKKRQKQNLPLAAEFALAAPAGMALGTAAVRSLLGGPSAVAIIGSLDALSAGALVWVGVVGLWAGDWMGHGGRMAGEGAAGAAGGLGALVAGVGFGWRWA
ncbi:hypothetical protein QBC33DRAFT_603027 [Phialemonium atrogriseum]|uniref:Uncharacterized protein n=1 Tax=Phialemonium atrogriseum TaxID=1093897 RepID=A0AAJ0FIX5_9PEZI|nr:uncharacterized protein QBC33DRAFT_603027 [Phialemonium atrogriseum]KAK1770036.1 hypothetical protein QBC33DRAFT_603027 [Phialemonium atrogriseum]